MHIINRLYNSEFDFPVRDEPPKVELMIASTPRSGSTIFTEYLWSTGVLGAPMEYPALPNRKLLYDRLQCTDWVDYWSKLTKLRTSPNGVFSYKMFPVNWLHLARSARDVYAKVNPTHVIFLYREDVLGQAISRSRALRTNIWFAGSEQKEVEYDENHISSCIKFNASEESFWKAVLERLELPVFKINYEDFMRDCDGSLKAICAHVGVEFDATQKKELPLISKQRDATTRIWRERYLNERGDWWKELFSRDRELAAV
jgi:trehalose 2-sulfotransferase